MRYGGVSLLFDTEHTHHTTRIQYRVFASLLTHRTSTIRDVADNDDDDETACACVWLSECVMRIFPRHSRALVSRIDEHATHAPALKY